MAKQRAAAVVLAGGASSRMGQPKALMTFCGEPLALRVLGRLRPQVKAVYLNADGPVFARFGVPLVPDPPHSRGAGPLAGVAAGLARAEADGFAWLATAPCDAPFLPRDLVVRLAARGGAAYAVSRNGPEPVFALWPVSARAQVEAALAAGRSSPRAMLETLAAAPVAFADASDFANVNTPQDFAAAEARARMLEADESDALFQEKLK